MNNMNENPKNAIEVEENVEETIERIIKDKSEQKKGSAFGRAIKKFFLSIGHSVGKVKKTLLNITIRTTAINFLLVSFSVAILSLILVFSVEMYFSQNGIDAEQLFVIQLRVTAVVVSVLIVFFVTFLSFLSLRFTLAPLRRIIKQVKGITSENLSMRLDEEGSENELKELAVAINRLLTDVDEAFSRQKKFVSDASHELRTPISVIQGYSTLLMRWGKDDKDVLDESIESIAMEADNMKKIVERLLFLAKIGKYIVNKQEFACSEILNRIIDGYKMADVKHNVIANVLDEGRVISDYSLLTECVRAMVDNAIKYSPENTDVILSCGKDGDKVFISVQDFGVGIKEEDQRRIFDRLYRCDNVRGRDGNSCGLGLTISQSIIEVLGGKIKVESEVGKGSTFTIILPLKYNAIEADKK
ncbi:MAG: HAMP domain-containing protein [Clostridiales bacterium]|nr:HAMP domain-containing protein [Clostridiales bacterium]